MLQIYFHSLHCSYLPINNFKHKCMFSLISDSTVNMHHSHTIFSMTFSAVLALVFFLLISTNALIESNWMFLLFFSFSELRAKHIIRDIAHLPESLWTLPLLYIFLLFPGIFMFIIKYIIIGNNYKYGEEGLMCAPNQVYLKCVTLTVFWLKKTA